MRFPFPFYTLFLIVAAFAVPLAAFCHLGVVGVLLGCLIGTTVSAVILAIRQKREVGQAVIVAAGSLVGAFFAQFFIPGIRMRPYTLADLVWDCAVVAIGAMVSGLFFAWASKR